MLKVICLHPGSSLPREIEVQGLRAEAAFRKAMQSGRVQVYRGRIMLLGEERAGKTSLKKSLLGIPFDTEEESTVGVEVQPTKFEVEIDQVKSWHCIERKKLILEFTEDKRVAEMIVGNMRELELEDKDKKTMDNMDLESQAANVPKIKVFITNAITSWC